MYFALREMHSALRRMQNSDSSSGGKTEGIPVTAKWTDDRTPTFSPTTDESDDVPSQSPPLQGNRARSFRWLRPPVPNRPPFCYLLSTSKCRSFWLSSVPYRHRRKPAPKRYEVSRKSIGGHKSQNFLIRPGSGLSRSKLAKNGQKPSVYSGNIGKTDFGPS